MGDKFLDKLEAWFQDFSVVTVTVDLHYLEHYMQHMTSMTYGCHIEGRPKLYLTFIEHLQCERIILRNFYYLILILKTTQ